MALRYAGYVSFAYFVVGFPQSIGNAPVGPILDALLRGKRYYIFQSRGVSPVREVVFWEASLGSILVR